MLRLKLNHINKKGPIETTILSILADIQCQRSLTNFANPVYTLAK